MAKFIKCPNCDYKNKKDAKFCESCGHSLEFKNTREKTKKCPACGAENSSDARFCSQCGEVISKRYQKKVSGQNSTAGIKNPEFIVLSVILVLFLFMLMANEFGSSSSQKVPPATQGTYVLEPAVAEIAHLFKCSCGSCDDPTLAHCQCPTAQEEHNAIRTLLRQGKTKSEIISYIKKKFDFYIGETSQNQNIDVEELSRILKSF